MEIWIRKHYAFSKNLSSSPCIVPFAVNVCIVNNTLIYFRFQFLFPCSHNYFPIFTKTNYFRSAPLNLLAFPEFNKIKRMKRWKNQAVCSPCLCIRCKIFNIIAAIYKMHPLLFNYSMTSTEFSKVLVTPCSMKIEQMKQVKNRMFFFFDCPSRLYITQRKSNRSNSNNTYSTNNGEIKSRCCFAMGKRHMGNICRRSGAKKWTSTWAKKMPSSPRAFLTSVLICWCQILFLFSFYHSEVHKHILPSVCTLCVSSEHWALFYFH